jgi:hypothetical protein
VNRQTENNSIEQRKSKGTEKTDNRYFYVEDRNGKLTGSIFNSMS